MKIDLKVLIFIILAVVIGGIAGYFVNGVFNTKPNQILQQNSEYILVKKYSWNNRDSVVCKYPADKVYTAIVTGKEKNSYYVGIPGKGGHPQSNYYITISGNNTVHRLQDSRLYHKYNNGDVVKVKEVWYPRHHVTVY
jgi:hypothetical protein